MIARTLGSLIVLLLGGLLTNFANAGSDSDTERENLSACYLQLLPDESLKSLSDWCAAHIGEPVSTNPVIDVPNYVSCDEVNLVQLSRGVEELHQEIKGFDCDDPEDFAKYSLEQQEALKTICNMS